MTVLRVGALPAEPLDAAARFHAEVLPRARAASAQGGDLTLVFDPADHTHTAWRRAAVQELARIAAPLRVNAVAGEGDEAIAAACAYLDGAAGVTGQLLPLDGTGAGRVLYPEG